MIILAISVEEAEWERRLRIRARYAFFDGRWMEEDTTEKRMIEYNLDVLTRKPGMSEIESWKLFQWEPN